MKTLTLLTLLLTLNACAHLNHDEAIGKLDDQMYKTREREVTSGNTTYKSQRKESYSTGDGFAKPTPCTHPTIKKTPPLGQTQSSSISTSWKF